MSITAEIRKELESLYNEEKAEFTRKLTPTMKPESVLGIQTPALRDLAKKYSKKEDIDEFLSDLPHKYFEENQLHSFILCLEKDFEKCLAQVDAFLPHIDNWATCDQLSPKIFKKRADDLLLSIEKWINTPEKSEDGMSGVYTIRFGIGMLMEHFLNERFDVKYSDMVAQVRSDEYYINMEIAWYFATALAKQYDSILPYIEQNKLDIWTHNKTIQKAIESYRITPEQKEYLRTLKIKNKKINEKH